MEINRYPRKDRLDKEGKAAIRIMVHYYNKRLPISTGEKVNFPDGWDSEKQKVKQRQPFAAVINQKLDNIEKTLQFVFQVSSNNRIELDNDSFKNIYEAVYAQILASGASETQDSFTNLQLQQAYEAYLVRLQGPAPDPAPELEPPAEAEITVLGLMDKWIEDSKNRIVEATGRPIAQSTIISFRATVARFAAFEVFRGEPLTLECMNKQFYDAFRDYMIKELKQEINNFGKHVKRLKQFLTWCQEHDETLIINPRYSGFKAPSRYRGVDFLLPDELQAIQYLDFGSTPTQQALRVHYIKNLKQAFEQAGLEYYYYQVELARDIFLMCCYTGLRISDAQYLAHSDIKRELIIIDTQKTGQYCYIPYFDDEIFKPVELVRKYRSSDDLIFPKCPKINAHLKVVQQLARISRLVLSTKIGRKTFCTTKIYQGVPKNIVMQATGHKTEASFNRYLGVNEQELISLFKQQARKAS